MNTKELESTYIAQTYARFPVTFVKGEGSLLWDDEGREYIDLGSGIAVSSFGFGDEAWVNAVCAQAQALQHVSNLYYTQPQAKLAQLLCQRTGLKRVFFSNSGAEANECAIKAARKYSSDQYGEGRSNIVTLTNGFHGRTITTLSATGQAVFHKDFGPFTPGFVHVEPNDFPAIQAQMDKPDCCAVMLELVQGEGGVNVLERDYVQRVAAYAAQKDILVVLDEVQTGNGRTGSLYAFEQFGITPDIVSTAKGLGGGLPIGATLLGDKTADTLNAGSHGSTFGGNPVCAAGALSVIERLDEALMAQVREKHAYILGELAGAKGVKGVSGMGLMLGIETQRAAKDIVNACLARGVLALTAKDRVRLLPALNIPMDVLAKGIGILKEEIAK